MRTLTNHLFAALLGTALLASCSRPVAYFQPTAREHFAANKPEKAAVAAPVEAVETGVVSTEVPAVATEQVAQVKWAVSQVEAYVRNDSKLAASKTLNKRMARLNKLLTTATDKATVSTTAASTRKMTFMERTMLKKMDKKIKSHVAPDKTDAMNSNIRLGLIVGIVGLLLLVLGGGSILGIIGLVGFVAGLVLILLGIINNA